MSNQVKISKICIEIGSKKIELTLKQAHELKEVLDHNFGGVVEKHIYPYPNYPYTWPTYTTTTDAILTASPNIVTTGYAEVNSGRINCGTSYTTTTEQ